MNKICICGDTRAGKTTFLKAITKINGYPHFVSDPEWPENRDFYEKGIVATSGYSHLKGELVVEENKQYPVDFLDYPGEDFGEGFVLNGRKEEKLSEFICEGSFLYFFIEPDNLNTTHLGALINLLHFFEACHKQQGKAANACLVLTKADTCSEDELPERTQQAVEALIEQRAPGFLRTLRSHANSFTCCAISAKGEEMDTDSRRVFFEPYFQHEDKRKRYWLILKGAAVIMGAILLCLAGDAFREWDAESTINDPKHSPWLRTDENLTNYDNKCRKLLAELEKKASENVNIKNLDDYLNELKEIGDPDNRKYQIVHNLKEKVREQLHDKITTLLQSLKTNYHHDDLRAYKEAVLAYKNRFGELPTELIFDERKMDLPMIKDILNIGNHGIVMYTSSRVAAISEFCQKCTSLSPELRSEINEALMTARMLASNGTYQVNVSCKKFEKPTEAELTLSTSPYTEDQSDTVSFHGDWKEKHNIRFRLEWNAGHSIHLSIWEDSDILYVSPDEIVHHSSLSSTEHLSIHDFCSNDWFSPNWKENSSNVRNVQLKCSVTDPNGEELTTERLNQVYKYVYSNQFWNELQSSLSNDNN